MTLVPRASSSAGPRAPTVGDDATPPGFLFDPNRCTGCAACSLACATENALGWGASWRQIVSFNPERRPGLPSFHVSLACNHCDDAPCVAHCPTGAMHRDPVTGAVLVDEARCIGCRYCGWVCPYEAPRFDAARRVVAKCTLCHHRLKVGETPACVEACPTDALEYGPLRGESRIPGFPEAPVGPRIRFAPLRRGASPPDSTWSLPAEALAAYCPTDAETPRRERPGGLIPVALTFRGEWPLWAFTSGLAGLVGWIGAAHGGVPAPLVAFLAIAASLVALSTLHLGRPLLAWRATARLRTSALSREVAGVAAFLGTATLWLASGGAALGGAAAALGLLTLVAVDRVYNPVRCDRGFDSADTLLTGPLVAAALVRSPWGFGTLAALKLLAAGVGRRHRPARASHLALRTAALAGPLALWALAPRSWDAGVLVFIAVAELADRARFYRELSIPGPREAARREATRLDPAQPPQPPPPPPERRNRLLTMLLKIDPNWNEKPSDPP